MYIIFTNGFPHLLSNNEENALGKKLSNSLEPFNKSAEITSSIMTG